MSTYQKVLVVDDDPEMIIMLLEILNLMNIQAISFEKPLWAIKFFQMRSEKIDLLITDYSMPKINGLEMMRKIHQFEDTPFLLLSGQLSTIKDSYAKHQIRRISKPFHPKEIFDLLSGHTPLKGYHSTETAHQLQ